VAKVHAKIHSVIQKESSIELFHENLLKNKKMRRFLLIFLSCEKILFVNFFREGISIEPATPPFGLTAVVQVPGTGGYKYKHHRSRTSKIIRIDGTLLSCFLQG
jgi:hypothetical protein